VLCAPAFGANPARPGTLNYIEGTAHLQDKQLKVKDVGSTELNTGEVLSTEEGKAEILLTPGVFLRIDGHSAVKMISPGLTLTQVELERGRAGVEVDEIYPANDLEIIAGGVATQLMKTGYYEFSTNPAAAMVFKGRAEVKTAEGKRIGVKGHRELALTVGTIGEPAKFDTRKAEDEFYGWSRLRSQYLAEANNRIAGEYAGVAGFYPGWYWDPYMWNYTFIGAYPYWSPFGYGFYPPYWGGYYYYGGHGYGGRGYGGDSPHGGEGGSHGVGGGPHGGGGGVSGGGGGHR
jgi:uncharacterized membrane protein YgcG